MKTINVKLPSKKKRISIIRSESKIQKELNTKSRMNRKEQDAKELKEQPVVFIEKFVISNYNKPLQINLSNVKKEVLEYEEVKEEIQLAYDKGFDDGRNTTHAALSKEFEKYDNWIKRFDILSEKLHEKYKDKVKELEDSILSLAVMVAEHIIRKEVEKDDNIVIEQVKEAISSVEDELIFKIKLNPDDKKILESVQSSLLNDKEKANKINIIPDRSIDQGSCILETSAGTIDATIRTRLEKLHDSLAEEIKSEEQVAPQIIKEEDDIVLDMNIEAEEDELILSSKIFERGVVNKLETGDTEVIDDFNNKEEVDPEDVIIIPDEGDNDEDRSDKE